MAFCELERGPLLGFCGREGFYADTVIAASGYDGAGLVHRALGYVGAMVAAYNDKLALAEIYDEN